jgi:hypothetical protein
MLRIGVRWRSLCGASNVSLANAFGANQQDAPTPKTITTYLGLLYSHAS